MNKMTIALILICSLLSGSLVTVLATRIVVLFPQHYQVIEKNTYQIKTGDSDGQIQFSWSVHSTVKQYRWIDGHKYLIYSFSHPAALTQLFENLTAAKITGDSTWNLTDYMSNTTYIALGHDVGLATTSTVLPGEWNRTAGSFEYIGVGQWNYTASFYPSGSGTTNSTSMNWLSGIGTALSMACYDTFSTITYTSNDQIDVEWNIDISYS